LIVFAVRDGSVLQVKIITGDVVASRRIVVSGSPNHVSALAKGKDLWQLLGGLNFQALTMASRILSTNNSTRK
jgi:hypothetical protein